MYYSVEQHMVGNSNKNAAHIERTMVGVNVTEIWQQQSNSTACSRRQRAMGITNVQQQCSTMFPVEIHEYQQMRPVVVNQCRQNATNRRRKMVPQQQRREW